MPKWKYRCIMLWFYLQAWAHRIIGVVANGSQHRQPKIERVCGTCADWKTCTHTESWRIRQSCSRECGCYWKPAQLRASA